MGKLSSRDLPGEAQILLRRRAAASHQSLRAYLYTRVNDAESGRELAGAENVIAGAASLAAGRASLGEAVSVLGGDQGWMAGHGTNPFPRAAGESRFR